MPVVDRRRVPQSATDDIKAFLLSEGVNRRAPD
jgi:hypothetical protein